ncbi:MAG: MFS transporter [Acidobacteriota bacterium]|nr:MFS transporter [Acidobacteriota bacterium]
MWSLSAAPDTDDHRWLVLGICCLSLLIVGTDTTIVNVALPAIRRSLHASLSGLQWIVDAYTLVLGSFLILGGSTGDRLGRKRVFQTGLVTFVVGSALCAAAPSLAVLVAARVFQALGGAMLNPVALSIVRNVFHDPHERARAIGFWGAAFGLSLGLGPVLGGAFVSTIGWRFVFLANIPVGLVAFLLTAVYVPESRAEHPRRIDTVGQLLVIAGLGAVTYAIIEGQAYGWASITIIALFAAALAAFTALAAYERRHVEPLVDVRFFRSAPFSGAAVSAICAFGAYGAFLFLNTLYLQDARGFSALDAGLCTLPLATATVLLAPLTGRLVARIGTRRPLLIAGVALAVAPLLLTTLTPHTPLALLFAAYVIFGAGLGLVNPPITSTAISAMPPAQAGVAGAITSASRQVGATIGIALVGAVVGTSSAVRFGPAFARATHPGWWLIAGFAAILLVVGALTTTPRAFAAARDAAAHMQPERVPG